MSDLLRHIEREEQIATKNVRKSWGKSRFAGEKLSGELIPAAAPGRQNILKKLLRPIIYKNDLERLLLMVCRSRCWTAIGLKAPST